MATIRLTQDFKEFLSLLNSEKIEYMLIGGYAAGLYGVPRPTKDLDVWVSVAVENLDRLIRALEKNRVRPGINPKGLLSSRADNLSNGQATQSA